MERESKQPVDPQGETQRGIFQVIDYIGEGDFAKVMKCINTETGEIFAVKALKKSKQRDILFQRELSMFNAISELDPDAYNIVRLIDTFRFGKTQFMAFETLDVSVTDLINQQGRETFSLNEIRPMAKDLLVALEGLRKVGIMHTDIKPENIMLVDHQRQPFRVKLIDFGSAYHNYEVNIGLGIQPRAYRAPEVILGLPLTEAVDLWSLGCCLIQWYVGCCPFESWSNYDQLKKYTQLMGTPEDELLNEAAYVYECFIEEGSQWRFKTPQEYEETIGYNPEILESRLDAATDLEDVITNFSLEQTCPEIEDMRAFIDLLKKMCHLDPEKRITPSEALCHPFITMDHLKSVEQTSSLLTYTLSQSDPLQDSREDEGIQNNEEQQRCHDDVSKSPSKVTSESSGTACPKEEPIHGISERPNEDSTFGPREDTICQPTNQKQCNSPVYATNAPDKSLGTTDSSSDSSCPKDNPMIYQPADQQEETQPPKVTKQSLNKKSSSSTSTSSPVNDQPTNQRNGTGSADVTKYPQESSGKDSSHPKDKPNGDTGICQSTNQRPASATRLSKSAGDVPEKSPRKSSGAPCATSEEVCDPKPMIYEPSKDQGVIGDITNDERKSTSPSKKDNRKSTEPTNAASSTDYTTALPSSVEQKTAAHNNEEKTDVGTSSDTAALHPEKPSVEDTNQHSSCRMVRTKIRVEVQQSGAWSRRTLRITIKT